MRAVWITAVATSLAVLVFSQWSKSPPPTLVQFDIKAQGDATVRVSRGNAWHLVWAVTCGSPLRGCVARTAGAVLRVDRTGEAWLSIAQMPGTVLLLGSASGTDGDATDITSLVRRPLDQTALDLLSQSDGEIFLSSDGQPILALQIVGIADVLAYLKWLESPLARGMRDARHWPRAGQPGVEHLVRDHSESLDVM